MTTNITKKISSIIQITGNFLKQWMQDKIYEKPKMCSVIEPMHEAIGRCGGLVSSQVATVTISKVEDRITYEFNALSLCREMNNFLSLCNIGQS